MLPAGDQLSDDEDEGSMSGSSEADSLDMEPEPRPEDWKKVSNNLTETLKSICYFCKPDQPFNARCGVCMCRLFRWAPSTRRRYPNVYRRHRTAKPCQQVGILQY